MNRKMAVFLFLGVCVVLAVLLFTETVTPLVSGIIFAFILILFGIVSRGFRK
jgi:hypothetical protein